MVLLIQCFGLSCLSGLNFQLFIFIFFNPYGFLDQAIHEDLDIGL